MYLSRLGCRQLEGLLPPQYVPAGVRVDAVSKIFGGVRCGRGALARDVRPEGASKRPLAGRVSARAAEDFDAVRNGSHGDFKGFLSALWTAG